MLAPGWGLGSSFALGVVACVGLAACAIPPVNPGFVSTVPRQAGALDASLQGGAGLGCVKKCSGTLAWGSLHVDPYLTPRLSIPIEGALMDVGGKVPAESTRLGLRYRVGDNGALGLGSGPTFAVGGEGDWVGGTFDLEAAVGTKLGDAGAVSIAVRPTFANTTDDYTEALYAPVEAAAMLELGRGVALSVHVGGGAGLVSDVVKSETLSQPAVAFGGGAGVLWRVDSIVPSPGVSPNVGRAGR